MGKGVDCFSFDFIVFPMFGHTLDFSPRLPPGPPPPYSTIVNMTMSGACWTQTFSITVKLTLIGDVVTFEVPTLQRFVVDVDNVDSTFDIAPLPAQFRPRDAAPFVAPLAMAPGFAGLTTFPGLFTANSNGILNVRDLEGGQPFALGSSVGLVPVVAQYRIH
jgi:hypothetical protein